MNCIKKFFKNLNCACFFKLDCVYMSDIDYLKKLNEINNFNENTFKFCKKSLRVRDKYTNHDMSQFIEKFKHDKNGGSLIFKNTKINSFIDIFNLIEFLTSKILYFVKNDKIDEYDFYKTLGDLNEKINELDNRLGNNMYFTKIYKDLIKFNNAYYKNKDIIHYKFEFLLLNIMDYINKYVNEHSNKKIFNYTGQNIF